VARPSNRMSSADPKADDARRGVAALLGCAAIWGALPIYLDALRGLSATLIIAYRLVLCCVFVLVWLRLRGELAIVRNALGHPQTRLRLIASALLISTNWLVYVWAVGQGRVVEASLGYFITPLLNVVLGVLVLRERLRRLQWSAVACAALGVLYLTLRAGAPPFISLSLALSFSAYGLLRKTVPVEALSGLAAETLLITPLGAAYVAWAELTGHGAVAHGTATQLWLLLGAGAITAFPLWFFSYGARRLNLATVGLIGYVSPTIQLLVGLYYFHERFDPHRWVGFTCIWSGLILYSADAVMTLRQNQRV
jgi:chloramphenicol-sensitive protein RarD